MSWLVVWGFCSFIVLIMMSFIESLGFWFLGNSECTLGDAVCCDFIDYPNYPIAFKCIIPSLKRSFGVFLKPVFLVPLSEVGYPLGLFVTVFVTLLGNSYEDADWYAC